MILVRERRHRKALLVLLCAAACGQAAERPVDTTSADVDSVAIDTSAPAPRRVNTRPLSPLADSIAQRLVFVPSNQSWFTAAGRAKRLLVDIGRVDATVNQPPSRLAAYKEAVAARAPLQTGTRLRVGGHWGADDGTVSGYDVWNGRIVATLELPPRVDSIARAVDPLVAVVQRADSSRPPADASCQRAPADSGLVRRIAVLRDSLLQKLREGDKPPFPRLVASLKPRSSHVTGCFQPARAIVVVALVAGDHEWVRERALLVMENGDVAPLALRDYRFRSHDLLVAFDADEDGIDEVASRAYTERGGGTVVLRLAEGKRLERLSAGFSYER